ncbi:MAG: hypothetical protein KIT22_02620 [Verrucomicrobiae bacterium]|nr:hypothetical protein [Verrucomicrobiae bacterium]
MAAPSINLQDPFQGRRWLRLLVPDPECGFRLAPQLDVPARSLGFSLTSNRFGLRGPDDATGDGVLLGTSFTMGIAVNNGENWWELGVPGRGWMNLGIAVGFREWENLLNRFYQGAHDRAVLLYHPNFWVHCRLYERWRKSGLDVFKSLRWRTDLPFCAYLKLRRALRRPASVASGRLLDVPTPDGPMEVDASYVDLDPDADPEFLSRNLAILTSLLARFREVQVVRLRVKQEVVPDAQSNDRLRATCRGYDRWYEILKSGLASHPRIQFNEPPTPELADFHLRDSHWNARGNHRFASWIAGRLGNAPAGVTRFTST